VFKDDKATLYSHCGAKFHKLTVCASVGSANDMNELLLVGMQLPEKYKENLNVLSE
jgi:hypothetical protein